MAGALAAFVVGIVLGALAVVVLVVLTRQRGDGAAHDGDEGRLTAAWSLAELGPRGLLVIRSLDGVDAAGIPAGWRVVCPGSVPASVLRACDVRRPADGRELRADVAVAADGGRALLFPAGARPGALALSVHGHALAARLSALAEEAWAAAEPLVERRSLADLAGDEGLPVEAEGRVAQVLPRAPAAGAATAGGDDGSVLLRLEDGGHGAAVLATAPAAAGLEGRRVRVRGRLARDAGGYPVLAAESIVPLD